MDLSVRFRRCAGIPELILVQLGSALNVHEPAKVEEVHLCVQRHVQVPLIHAPRAWRLLNLYQPESHG